MSGARRERRSLTHVGGATRTRGDASLATVLAAALDVPSSLAAEDEARAHVHGFHTYPARLHPLVARRVVAELGSAGSRVFDPFCGSGTVLVEARLAGREAWGADLNPLAARLARLKVEGRTPGERAALVEGARRAAATSDARRKARAGPSRRYGPEDLELFDRHVLLALDGVRVGIEAEPDPRLRADLGLVLASILIKLSRRASDTRVERADRSFSQRLPARLFVSKAEELATRLAEVSERLGTAPPARVEERDARGASWVPAGTVELVLTSPPYPGVYDYLEHHDARLRWLGLDAAAFARGEMGARRASGAPELARDAFERATTEVLRGLEATLAPAGTAVLIAGDGAFGRLAVPFDQLLLRLAPGAGLGVAAIASQQRPDFSGAGAGSRSPRFEHAVALRRDAPEISSTKPRQVVW